MRKIQNYIEENKDRFLDELISLLKIPSVSADKAYKKDVLNTADFVLESLKKAGCDLVEMCETPGYPIIYGEKIIDKKLPTVLVYGHYDVQPADPIELWTSPPFEPVIKKTAIHPEGAIFARGACDDKGQMYMHVKALEYMTSSSDMFLKKLKCRFFSSSKKPSYLFIVSLPPCIYQEGTTSAYFNQF